MLFIIYIHRYLICWLSSKCGMHELMSLFMWRKSSEFISRHFAWKFKWENFIISNCQKPLLKMRSGIERTKEKPHLLLSKWTPKADLCSIFLPFSTIKIFWPFYRPRFSEIWYKNFASAETIKITSSIDSNVWQTIQWIIRDASSAGPCEVTNRREFAQAARSSLTRSSKLWFKFFHFLKSF